MLLDMGKQAVKEIIKLFAYHLKMGLKCKTCNSKRKRKSKYVSFYLA